MITDELREFIDEHLCLGQTALGGWKESAHAIADRIDAEHEKAMSEQPYTIDMVPITDERMAEHGWVRLPKDADGEYIHIGDVMEGVDKYDTLREVTGKVIDIDFEVDGIVSVAIQSWSEDGKSWHRAYLDPFASVYRHHKPPTVEDVLEEMYDALEDARIPNGSEKRTYEEIIAEYASKLQLKENS